MAGEVKLSTLRVTADLDATPYVKGAQQKVAADEAMGQSSKAVFVQFQLTEDKISQSGDVLQRLSRQYVDGFASAQKFNGALNQLASGIDKGKISLQQASVILDSIYQKFQLVGDAAAFAGRGQGQLSTMIEQANTRLREQIFWHEEWLREFNKQPIGGGPGGRTPANQNTLGAFGAFTTGQQLQDIAVTAAMGQSIPTIALQQGLQLGTALQIQLDNAKEAGLSMRSALAGAFASLISPVNLLAIGITAAAAAAIQFFTSSEKSAATLNDTLEQSNKAVRDLADAYNVAGINAEEFGRKSQIAAEAQFRQSQRALEEQMRASGQGLAVPGRFRPGIFGGVQQEQDLTGTVAGTMLEVQQAVAAGRADLEFLEQKQKEITETTQRMNTPLEDTVALFREWFGLRPTSLQETQDEGNAAIGVIEQLKRRLEELEATRRLLAREDRPGFRGDERTRGLFARMHPEAGLTIGAEGDVETLRNRARLEGELQQIQARTVEERIAAARRLAEIQADTIPNLTETEKLERANTAATLERARAERELADAMRERQFGREDLIAQGRIDLQTIGQTVGVAAQLRKEFELMQELRRQERETGVPMSQKEADAVRDVAKAYGELTEQITRKQVQADLAFEASIQALNAEEAAIARRLRGTGAGPDSMEAAMLRQINQIERMKETWQDLFDTVNDGMDSVVDALFEGTDPLDALKQSVRDLARQMFDLAITNPLKNFLTGGNFNTIADMGVFGAGASSGRGGGFGGVLGNLFGAQGALGRSVASMSVQAGIVNVNGTVAGGASGLLGGGDSFETVTSFSGGTSGYSSAEIQNRIDLAHNAAFVQPGGLSARLKAEGFDVDEIASSRVSQAFGDLSESTEEVASGFDEVAKGSESLASTLAQSAGSIVSSLTSLVSRIGGGGSIPSMFGGGLFSGLTSAGGGILPLAGPADSAGGSLFAGMWHVLHSGGIAGISGGQQRYARMAIDGLPRYHYGGLAGDEVPAILRRGEPVFRSMQQARQMSGSNDNMMLGAILAQLRRMKLQATVVNVDDPNKVGRFLALDAGEEAFVNTQRRTGSGRRL